MGLIRKMSVKGMSTQNFRQQFKITKWRGAWADAKKSSKNL